MKQITLAILLSLGIAHADTYLVSPEGKYLGNLNNKYDTNSIYNKYGRYGSKYSPDSINNPYGRYGSKYSPYSPNNPYATQAPIIINRPRY
jgi:hypothetical protein